MKKVQKILLSIVATFMMATSVNASEILQSKIDAGEKNIILDANYTEDITINENQKITIDLNGYTLAGSIQIIAKQQKVLMN